MREEKGCSTGWRQVACWKRVSIEEMSLSSVVCLVLLRQLRQG